MIITSRKNNIKQLNLNTPVEPLVLKLQHKYNESIYTELFSILFWYLFIMLRRITRLSYVDIEDILQDYFINDFDTAIRNYNHKDSGFKYYIQNIVKKRIITYMTKKNKEQDIYSLDQEVNLMYIDPKMYPFFRRINYHETTTYDGKSGKFYGSEIEKKFLHKRLIEDILNKITKLHRFKYRIVMYFYILVDLEQESHLMNLIHTLFDWKKPTIKTHIYRARIELSEMTGIHFLKRTMLIEFMKYIKLENDDINSIIAKIKKFRDFKTFEELEIEDATILKDFIVELSYKKNITKYIKVGDEYQ